MNTYLVLNLGKYVKKDINIISTEKPKPKRIKKEVTDNGED